MAPLIGKKAHAEDALRLHNGEALRNTPMSHWDRFSSGSMRNVFHHIPSGVVYKVDSWMDEGYDNNSELRNAQRLRRRTFEYVYIPKTSAFRITGAIVLAMEYIAGPMGREVGRDEYPEARRELFEKCRFADMHGDNFKFILDGPIPKIAPIDMGSNLVPEDEAPDDRVLSCGDGSVWGREDPW